MGQPVLTSELRVGLSIHLSHKNFGCVWKILSIEPMNNKGETWLNLVAPESRKRIKSRSIYARHIRANER
jgi:hypothetical protein